MKKNMIALLVLFSFSQAFAISGGEICSNADASIKVTYDLFGKAVVELKPFLDVEYARVNDALLKETAEPIVLSENTTYSCENKMAGDFTYGVTTQETVRTVTITRESGESFPEINETVINDHLICKSSTMFPSTCQ